MTGNSQLSRSYFEISASIAATLRSASARALLVLVVGVFAAGHVGPLAASAVDLSTAALAPSVSKSGAKRRAGDDRLLAWSVLASRGVDGAAERAALEHLFAIGEPLDGLSFAGSGLDFSRIQLGAVGGRAAQLRGVGFAHVKLVEAQFNGADLTGADFTKAKLIGANFTKAQMGGVKLAGADLSAASLRRASLERARMSGAILAATDMRDVSAQGAMAVGARMDGVIALNGDWRKADMTRAILVGANFTGAKLAKARFDGAEISGAAFLGAHGVATASFERAWAWADTPPSGLPSEIRIDLCDAGPGGAYRKAFLAKPRRGAARPEGC
ncbi:MAG: pentapeptide repeat-containing protein [Neomegalonema sp.]|nr:pentapeptide repeat-containing protein [Neomegalonema sp.]